MAGRVEIGLDENAVDLGYLVTRNGLLHRGMATQ